MRGSTARQLSMLSAVTPDELVPAIHPIRRIRPMVELALESLAPTFDAMYAAEGRPSIPPEHLLKGCLLMALYCDSQRASVLRAPPVRPALQVVLCVRLGGLAAAMVEMSRQR